MPRGGRTERDRARKAAKRATVAKIRAQTTCARCGRQPIEWHDPNGGPKIGQLVKDDRANRVILAEIARRTPLCGTCHRKVDQPRMKVCHQGHAMTPDNVYEDPDGRRRCRTCRKESWNAWRDRQR